MNLTHSIQPFSIDLFKLPNKISKLLTLELPLDLNPELRVYVLGVLRILQQIIWQEMSKMQQSAPPTMNTPPSAPLNLVSTEQIQKVQRFDGAVCVSTCFYHRFVVISGSSVLGFCEFVLLIGFTCR